MRTLLAATAAAAVLLGAGCEKKSATAPAGPAAAPAPAPAPSAGNTVLIGEVFSLTGDKATFGISSRNGIEMAVKEANAAGGVKGKKIETRVYDDQGKPEEAANATTRLVNQDQVVLVLGEVASSNSIAMAHVAQPAQVPMITPTSTNPKVTEVGDYIFRVCFIDPFQGFVMAKFARDNLKLNKVAVLRDLRSDYSTGLTDVFTRKFTEMGGKIVAVETYNQGDSDFRGQLTAIKRAGPDGIYIPGYYNEVGVIAKQARELGLTVPLMGGDGWDSEKLFELGGSAVEGHYLSNHYSADDPSPRVRKFVADYKAAYGSVPDALATIAYDAAGVAIAAMRRAPDLSRKSIRDAIAQTKDYPGVGGSVTLDERRNAVKPAVVLKVGKGKFDYVTTINP
ncbi:MAG TPA: ABC transporter substrate-binding protein [Myxococcaceae bacterium]|nr:ABC transporter substrate-binding protein [Myxococcaceae bacterium]